MMTITMIIIFTMTINNDNNAIQCITIITMKFLFLSLVDKSCNDYNIVLYFYNIVMHFTIL